MPHEINWYEPDKILLWKFEGHMTLGEINESIQQLDHFLNQAVGTISIIMDFRESTNFPIFMPTSMPGFGGVVNHKNLDWMAIVGLTSSIGFMLKIISKAFKFQYAIFDNVEEAVDFLRQVAILQKPSVQASPMDETNDAQSEVK